jgi:hypothetical protein
MLIPWSCSVPSSLLLLHIFMIILFSHFCVFFALKAKVYFSQHYSSRLLYLPICKVTRFHSLQCSGILPFIIAKFFCHLFFGCLILLNSIIIKVKLLKHYCSEKLQAQYSVKRSLSTPVFFIISNPQDIIFCSVYSLHLRGDHLKMV